MEPALTRPTQRKTWRGASIAIVAIVVATSGALAEAGPSRGAETLQDAPDTPPAMTLVEAVRLTIERSPAVLQAEQQVLLREGARRSAAGVFNLSLQAAPSWEYVKGPLTPASSSAENRTRTLLRSSGEEFQELSDSFAASLEETPPTCPPDFTGVIVNGELFTCDNRIPSTVDILETIGVQNDLEVDDIIENLTQFNIELLEKNRQLFGEGAIRARLGLERRSFFPLDETRKAVGLDLGVGKALRNGMSFRAGVQFAGVEDNFIDKPRDPTFGGKGIRDNFFTAAGVELNVPLGKGLGRTSAQASERAAISNLEGSREQRLHTISQQVLSTVLSYLNAAAAQESVRLLEISLGAQRQMLAGNQQLVEAGELPRSDLDRMRARAAEVEGNVASAQLQLLSARSSLAQSIGLEADEFDVGPLASDVLALTIEQELDIEALLRRAADQRRDLQAAVYAAEASQYLVDGTRSDLKRRFDLLVTFAYSASYDSPFFRLLPDEIENPPADSSVRYYSPTGLVRAIKERWSPTVSVALSVDFPFKNSAARGRLARARASLRRSDINLANLGRVIGDNVVEVAGSLRHSRQELARRESAAEQQERSWEAQQTMREAGEATLIDTLLTEEQLTSARIQVVRARLDYAAAAARLRFETGALVEFQGEEQSPQFRGLDLVGQP